MAEVRQGGSGEYGEEAGGNVVEVRQSGSGGYGEDAGGSEGVWWR
jgi:hypothetical protein